MYMYTRIQDFTSLKANFDISDLVTILPNNNILKIHILNCQN
jgi:hypothetical protein